MSAILSADDLNDFISPGVACIKPVETLPKQQPTESNPYEVTTEDKVAAANAPPASISLTDCLACSGCVTSAEAVLVSLQSHAEVLNTLDAYPELPLPWLNSTDESLPEPDVANQDGKIFIASVSPQTRASIAATYNVSEREAGNMIQHLLSGPSGLRSGGAQNSAFTYVLDTNILREIALVSAAEEVQESLSPSSTKQMSPELTASREEAPKKPILASACPGWICYAEKTHPHVLPHISRLKSPQALAGTLVKSVLARKFGVSPSKIWHLAVMPCFDKKLEASREELTDIYWDAQGKEQGRAGVRDVDCVITARELLMLAEARNIAFPTLSRTRLSKKEGRIAFPDSHLNQFLFPSAGTKTSNGSPAAGTSGGYLYHILQTHLHALKQSTHPSAEMKITRGRNADVVDYEIVDSDTNTILFRSARYYGFRNIQNLVRRLKPAKVSRLPGAAVRGGARKPAAVKASALAARGAAAGAPPAGAGQAMQEYAFVEVMACPGGCTNGGGQIKVGDVGGLRGSGIENGGDQVMLPQQKEWLVGVDEAYFSASDGNTSSEDTDREDEDLDMADAAEGDDVVDGISHTKINNVINHWAEITGVDRDKLVYTSYRKVESDVGKSTTDVERVAGLASTIGGGW